MKDCKKIILIGVGILLILFVPFPIPDTSFGCTQTYRIQEYSTIWVGIVGYDKEEWHMNSTPDFINVSKGSCEELGYNICSWPDNDPDYGEDCYGGHLIIERRYSFNKYS